MNTATGACRAGACLGLRVYDYEPDINMDEKSPGYHDESES